jgi:peroxiredoxin Q/BCP
MNVGDLVEDFVLPDERGVQRTLSGLLRDGPVVLFFYPGAFTRFCTAEACQFRDVSADLRAVGARAVGVSSDLVERQAAFAHAFDLGFPLLSDPAGEVRAAFGVRRSNGRWPTKRVTFVIDTDRRVLGIIRSEIQTNLHADRALEVLRRRPPSPRAFSWWRGSQPASGRPDRVRQPLPSARVQWLASGPHRS